MARNITWQVFHSLLGALTLATACQRSGNGTPGCAKSQFYDKSTFLRLVAAESNGGFVQIKTQSGDMFRCSAEIHFAGDSAQLATSRHCFVPLDIARFQLRVFQRNGYTDITVPAENVVEFAPFLRAQSEPFFHSYEKYVRSALGEALKSEDEDKGADIKCRLAMNAEKPKSADTKNLACYNPDDIVVLTVKLPKDRPKIDIKRPSSSFDTILPGVKANQNLVSLRLRKQAAAVAAACSGASSSSFDCLDLKLPDGAGETFGAEFQRFAALFPVSGITRELSTPEDIDAAITEVTDSIIEMHRKNLEQADTMRDGFAYLGNFDLANFSDKRRAYGLFRFSDSLKRTVVTHNANNYKLNVILIYHDAANTPFFLGKQDSGSLLIHKDLGILGALSRVGDEAVSGKVNESSDLPPSEVDAPKDPVSQFEKTAAAPPVGPGPAASGGVGAPDVWTPSDQQVNAQSPRQDPRTQTNTQPVPDMTFEQAPNGSPPGGAAGTSGSVPSVSPTPGRVYNYGSDTMVPEGEVKRGADRSGC